MCRNGHYYVQERLLCLQERSLLCAGTVIVMRGNGNCYVKEQSLLCEGPVIIMCKEWSLLFCRNSHYYVLGRSLLSLCAGTVIIIILCAGTVIIMCKNEVFDLNELHGMMQGRPTRLESKFRLVNSHLGFFILLKGLGHEIRVA